MIYVMSDIHGNMRRFRSIMNQIDLKPEDRLYILGDVIDRHPDGIDILEEIIPMPNVKMLLGNHEHMMLCAIYPNDDLPWQRDPGRKHNLSVWYSNGGRITHFAFQKLNEERQNQIFQYLKSLPINLDISVNGAKYKLVHSVPVEYFNEDKKWKYLDEVQYSVWDRRFHFDELPGTYTMIFGHTPTCFLHTQETLSIWRSENNLAIGIDCGSGFEDKPTKWDPTQGRLACLRLDDMKEFYSAEGNEV